MVGASAVAVMNVQNNVISIIGAIPQGCAAALLTVLLKGEACELYNIASGFTASVPEIADACVAAFGGSFKVVFKGKERPLSPISPNLMILDNSRLIALGFRPRVNILNGVKISAAILSESKGGV